MPQPVSRSSLLIGKEATAGTAVPGTFSIPVTSMAPVEVIPPLTDDAWRGTATLVHGAQQGPTHVTYDLGGNVHADGIGWMLVGVLGDDAVTGTAAPYTHAISVLNSGNFQPPTYTLIDNNGLEGISYAGCRFGEVSLDLTPAGLAKFTAKATARSWASSTIQAPAYTTTPPSAAWRAAVTINGTASNVVQQCTVDIKRSLDPLEVLGQQGPYDIFSAGDVTADWKLTVIMEAVTFRDNYRAGTIIPIDVNLTQGTTQLKLHTSSLWLTKADVTRGQKYVELTLEGQGLGTTGDAGASGGDAPIAVTLQNQLASGTYK